VRRIFPPNSMNSSEKTLKNDPQKEKYVCIWFFAPCFSNQCISRAILPNFPKLAKFPQTRPRKLQKKCLKLKKRLHLFLGIICFRSNHIKWFRKGFHTLSPRFPKILPRFQGNVPGFSPDQNFWVYACTPCTHAYYTSVQQTFCLA